MAVVTIEASDMKAAEKIGWSRWIGSSTARPEGVKDSVSRSFLNETAICPSVLVTPPSW